MDPEQQKRLKARVEPGSLHAGSSATTGSELPGDPFLSDALVNIVVEGTVEAVSSISESAGEMLDKLLD